MILSVRARLADTSSSVHLTAAISGASKFINASNAKCTLGVLRCTTKRRVVRPARKPAACPFLLQNLQRAWDRVAYNHQQQQHHPRQLTAMLFFFLWWSGLSSPYGCSGGTPASGTMASDFCTGSKSLRSWRNEPCNQKQLPALNNNTRTTLSAGDHRPAPNRGRVRTRASSYIA